MALKDYQDDYSHPQIQSGHWHIEPRESFDIDYIYESILYRNKTILEASGDLCQMFRKKITGTRCTNPACPAHNNWQQSGSPDCPVCFGVGFVGGYDFVEEIYIRFPMSDEKLQLTTDGMLRVVKPRIWTMPEPILRTFDMLINFSQPTILQEELIVDKHLIRGDTDLDVLDSITSTTRQIIRILKISNQANSDADYTENVDYVLSNNGVLWITDNQPELNASYFVNYQYSNLHYRRYQISNVSPSRWHGKTLHQKLEIDELDVTHPFYRITQSNLTDDEISFIYNPFPISEWFDRI